MKSAGAKRMVRCGNVSYTPIGMTPISQDLGGVGHLDLHFPT